MLCAILLYKTSLKCLGTFILILLTVLYSFILTCYTGLLLLFIFVNTKSLGILVKFSDYVNVRIPKIYGEVFLCLILYVELMLLHCL